MAVEKAQAALDQAKASLSQITAQRELQSSKIAVAEAALRSAEAQAKNADITLRRATDLLQKSAMPQATVDNDTAAAAAAHASLDQATANLALEREQLVVIDTNETAAKAQVAAAEANLLSSKFALDDTEIWSPIDGIVANRKTRVGEYVTAGTRMLSVVPINNLWIEANYRETQTGEMRHWRSSPYHHRQLSWQIAMRLRRGDRAGVGFRVRTDPAGQCHRKFHQDCTPVHRTHPFECA
jgi:membrane fusion protein (multidrug efflux system)